MAITFDPTKNYAEFGNAFFRGRLKGASGEARFKLIADTINAVTTVNIAGQAVTFSFSSRYTQRVTGNVLLDIIIDVPDVGVYLEFICFGDTATGFILDGVTRGRFNQRSVSVKCNPYNEIIEVSQGQHRAQLVTNVGYGNEGFIFCRYIRKTGSEATS